MTSKTNIHKIALLAKKKKKKSFEVSNSIFFSEKNKIPCCASIIVEFHNTD